MVQLVGVTSLNGGWGSGYNAPARYVQGGGNQYMFIYHIDVFLFLYPFFSLKGMKKCPWVMIKERN